MGAEIRNTLILKKSPTSLKESDSLTDYYAYGRGQLNADNVVEGGEMLAGSMAASTAQTAVLPLIARN